MAGTGGLHGILKTGPLRSAVLKVVYEHGNLHRENTIVHLTEATEDYGDETSVRLNNCSV